MIDFTNTETTAISLLSQGIYPTDPSVSVEEIAWSLCGVNENIAIEYMKGCIEERAFLDNVSYNSESSYPKILRAVQLHLSNRKK